MRIPSRVHAEMETVEMHGMRSAGHVEHAPAYGVALVVEGLRLEEVCRRERRMLLDYVVENLRVTTRREIAA